MIVPTGELHQITGILLAGTHSWANSTFDLLLPRTLLPVAHRPLIGYGLSWLDREGVRNVAVCGNRESRVLRSRLVRHVPHGMNVSYHEDPMPRGAAGCARDAAMATDSQRFVVADGTAIPNIDLDDLLLKHRSAGACVTVVVHAEARRNGDATIQVPSGVYVFERRAFEQVAAQGFCDIKEKLIPELYAAGERIVPYEAAAPRRVLDAATYMAVNERTVEHLAKKGDEVDGYVRRGNSLVHRDAWVADDAVFVGPVLVGPGARVLSGAVVVGPTSIGRDVTIGSGALISSSAVWRRSTVGDGAIVDRCIVGDDAVIEPGAQTFREVILGDPQSNGDAGWVVAQPIRTTKGTSLSFGARLGRLVFGEPIRLPSA